MSTFFEEDSSGDETTAKSVPRSEEEIAAAKESSLTNKAAGDDAFRAKNFDEALASYTGAINALKSAGLPSDSVILANRSATYLALKRFIPACHDAIQSSNADPTNWKAYWRQAVALQGMAKKKFRTRQAIEALEKCLTCDTLTADKRPEVEAMLEKARAFLQKQDDETPMADMSNCAPS
jgi:tetratricopeptide (TPR) repeat protein